MALGRWHMPLLALGLTFAAGGLALALYLGRSWIAGAASVSGAVMLTIALVAHVRSQRDARVRPDEPRPVPAPSPATLSELHEPVTSCPRCGFLDVVPVILAHQGNEVTCPRCDYVGEPVHFLHRQEYRAYVVALAQKR